MMGDKATARATAVANGVPGHPRLRRHHRRRRRGARRRPDEIGFPVMIKATAGGGGRGMRPCFNEDGLHRRCSRPPPARPMACFGNGECYLEKLVLNPHHIEFQVIGDSHGNVIHLGERDCSMQRRNQKIIEECPSPLLTPELRTRMGEASVQADPRRSATRTPAPSSTSSMTTAENFYFMEMNTRIQVEHPITEEVMGCELIKEQIRDRRRRAALRPRARSPARAATRSSAGSMPRIPTTTSRPAPAPSTSGMPPAARACGSTPTSTPATPCRRYYDSMIAKLIVTGATREIAIARMKRALGEFIIRGIKTTIPFQQEIIDHPDFIAGQLRHRLGGARSRGDANRGSARGGRAAHDEQQATAEPARTRASDRDMASRRPPLRHPRPRLRRGGRGAERVAGDPARRRRGRPPAAGQELR